MPEKIKEMIIKNDEYLYYVGATVISAAVHFLYSVYVKAHIEPLEYGIYSTCLLLQTYMTYAQLGSLNAFNRDYPQLIGAGETERAKKYRNTTFTFLLSVFGMATLVITVFLLTIGRNNDSRYTYGLILCAVTTTVAILENFLASRVRIDGNFRYTSFVLVAELLSVLVGFFMISRFGYYVLYFVTIGSMMIGILLYYKRGMSDLRLSVDRQLLRTIIISGMPLLINSLIWTVVNSIDQFVILGFINTEALGIYSIAQMAFSYMVLVPSAMSQLFYVKLGKVYGATKDVKKLNEIAIKYILILAVVISYIVICAYFFLEPLVNIIMPKYSGGVKSAQLLLLGLAIYAPTIVSGNILTILKKNAALLRGSVYLCVLNIICSGGLVIFFGANIENVALGTAISYLIRTVILVYQLKYNAGTDVKKMIQVSIVPVLILAGPGIILYHVLDNRIVGFVMAFAIAVIVTGVMYGKQIKMAFGGD